MTVALSSDNDLSGYLKIRILGNAVAAGLVGQVANPEGVPVFICEGWMHIITGATAASTANIGIAATGVDNAVLAAAFPLNGGADTMWTILARGASEAAAINAQDGAIWGAAQFLTVTSAAQASTGLVADLYLRYIRLSTA